MGRPHPPTFGSHHPELHLVVSQAHVLTVMPPIHLKDLLRVKAFLVGLERCPREGGRTRPACRAVSFPLLRLMGHFLGESGNSRDNLVLWAAILAAFFGSMRIGELFPPGEPLVWDDVTIRADYVLFRLRTLKVRSSCGDFVSIFRFPQAGLYPVAAIEEVRRAATEAGTDSGRDYVFTSRSDSQCCGSGSGPFGRIQIWNFYFKPDPDPVPDPDPTCFFTQQLT